MIDGLYLEIGAIAACILLSALFSGSETAITALAPARLEQLITRKTPGIKLLAKWRESPSTVLSFLLVANNLANILASSLATDLSLKTMVSLGFTDSASYAIAMSVGVMTFLILMFGEVLPKTFARHNPHAIANVLPLLQLFYFILWPMAKPLGLLGRRFISLAGGDPTSPPPTITEEELEYLIQAGGKEGSLNSEKEKMLSGVLSLEDSIAKEVMIPRTDITSLEAKTPLPEVMAVIREHKFSRYPVYQQSKDKIIGLFYAKDLLAYYENRAGQKPFSLRNFVRPPYFVPETKRLDELLREFQEERIHIAIVVDEYGGTAGLVTLEDIIEEMIGEIYDEYDKEEKLFIVIDDTTFIVHSKLPVEDLEEELGVDVEFQEEREYESLGGLIMELAGSVPSKGERFVHTPTRQTSPELHFTVLESDGVKLGKLKMVVIPRVPTDA